MANKNKLIPWLLAKSDKLNLKVEQLLWSNEFAKDFTDIRVHISIDGKSYYGFSGGSDSDLALTKAASEAIERAVSTENRFPTTNGFAAHIDLSSAETAAKNELIERDAILCHFYSNTPYHHVSLASVKSKIKDRAISWYRDRNIKPLLFELQDAGLLFVADGRDCNIKKFGFVLGAGNRSSTSDSFEAAVLETTRQLAHVLETRETCVEKSLSEFLDIKEPTFKDHGDLALNLEYAKKISYLFEGSSLRKFTPLDQSTIVTNQIKSRLPILSDCPLVFARAVSPQAQALFVGLPRAHDLNIARLKQFVDYQMSASEFSQLPHPFN